MKRLVCTVAVVLFALPCFAAYSGADLDTMERSITTKARGFEDHLTDENQVPNNSRWMLRSKHFVFGMPVLSDDRHDYKPTGQKKVAGISVLVREGFVVAHFDRMHCPLFVCQRWTEANYHKMKQTGEQPRKWKEDYELPTYTRVGGTSYAYNTTRMDRGHMARHMDNHGFGPDNAHMGCRMSNSVPQHKEVNRGDAWRKLEDENQEIVKDDDDIDVIWTISGALFCDKANPFPKNDFDATQMIGSGYGSPKATYKIVAWFDKEGRFQARGYVFEQDDRASDVKKYLTKIDDIERRAGVDFFPFLKENVERTVEGAKYDDMWGE